jgi:hypothetical protein
VSFWSTSRCYGKVHILFAQRITDDSDLVARFRQKAPKIMHVLLDDAVLLGAPAGGSAAIESGLQKKLSELKCLTPRLATLHAHDAFYLLIHCFCSRPKLLYTLRIAPCFAYDLLGQYDCVIQASRGVAGFLWLGVQTMEAP